MPSMPLACFSQPLLFFAVSSKVKSFVAIVVFVPAVMGFSFNEPEVIAKSLCVFSLPFKISANDLPFTKSGIFIRKDQA